MFDPNVPTLSTDLINQLSQLINNRIPHPSEKNYKCRAQAYWETSCPTPIIRPQPLQQQFLQDPRQYSRSRPTHRKLCFHCQRTNHHILECLDIKRLGQKWNALLKTLTAEQLEEFNEIIDESLCDSFSDKQILKLLEFTLN
ncbi:2795_t:CDS:2 [Gigaspora margarita]|uniref:2795_t:CDS:1 n=1 Tax=Gigaspora margarita TaxID=4874 RepID=A0ABM8W557_GIGMA|nr:2795_t:CDS:2 [Gigaspora margarita]